MANLKDINYGIGKYLVASDASDIPDIGTNRTNLDLLNFKVATNNAYALYNFKDGMIDAYQDQTGVDTATSTGEIYDSSGKYYAGSYSYPITGGTKTVVGLYTYHLFTSDGDLIVPAGGSGNVEALVQAGGGGGGGDVGGGGGAGGLVHDTSLAVTAQTYSMVIGGAASGTTTMGGTGGDSTGFGWTAKGGGGGGYWVPAGTTPGNPGGSGGAGGAYSGAGGATNQTSSGTGSSGTRTAYGNAGEASNSGNSNGGGAGSSTDGQSFYIANFDAGSIGGANYSGAPVTSSTGYFGGGGGSGTGNTPGGGAGAGAGSASGGTAPPGVAATGTWGSGGGGGGEWYGSGGNSAQGCVAVRYLTTDFVGTNNITLISNAQTAQADPTEGRLMIYEQDVDVVTLNTDIKGYVSRDNGTTYTQTTLTEDTVYAGEGEIDNYTKLMLHCDGANDGTTFTDSSLSPHTVTAQGSTHTDTAVKKFGTASAQFGGDGTGDDLVIPDSTDWDIGTGDFTFDTWIYPTDNGSSYRKIFASGGWGGTTGEFDWVWDKTDAETLRFIMYDGTNIPVTTSTGTIANDVWTHVAVVRSGSTITQYINGTADGTVSSSVNIVSHGALQVGRAVLTSSTTQMWQGYIDELRVSKGIARWTANFPVAVAAYEYQQRLLSGSVDISGQPAGTDMKYKVETLNSKNLKLHGASLLWA